ncbi:porin [Photobacterium gaetbulicola]|uniref:Porin n=1 Tax=Photobacterium gaetbulicola Gung47 TaxID=658445 RepID=A0A0C5WNY1_9GAMM|nr:porin [Photobacterium gaetbulicola]AJR08082.1 porin [Photobacterium gaetbulicola Gung47]PSU12967.1 porin [Photobacterium gaetbulicola]
MKKTLLAVAIPAVLFAHSISAAEVYKSDEGFVDFYGQLRTQLEKKEDKDVTLNAGSSRAGVQAQYSVTDSVDVFGKVEFSLNFTDGEDYEMKNRLHFAGVDTDFGKITFGRQWIVSDDVGVADYSYFNGGSGNLSGILSGGRHDSYIKYNYEGEQFWLAAGFGLPEDDTNQELAELYVGSSINGFSFNLGGGVNTDKSASAVELENTYYEATVDYTTGPFLIGFTYYTNELKDTISGLSIDGDSYTVAATYSWADNATAYAGYEYTEQKLSVGSLSEDSTVIYVGSDYHFNSYVRVYAEYAYLDGATLGYTNKESDNTVEPGSRADGDNYFGVGARVYW